MGWFSGLIQMATRFRGAAALLVFCISALVLLLSWLFGSNSFGTLFTNASQLSSTEALILALSTIFLAVGVLSAVSTHETDLGG